MTRPARSSWTRSGGPLGRDEALTAEDAVDPSLHERVEADTGAACGVDHVTRDAGAGAGDDRPELGSLDQLIDVDAFDDRVDVDPFHDPVEVETGDDWRSCPAAAAAC